MQAKSRSLSGSLALYLAGIVLAGLAFRAAYIYFYKTAYPVTYKEVVMEYSARYNVSPALVFAVIRTESGFRTDVESSENARGLMQITEKTFEWARDRMGDSPEVRYEDLFQSDQNIQYGIMILAMLLQDFDSVDNALCGYHAGWGHTSAWLQNPRYSQDGESIDNIPFGDTKRYVAKVKQTQRIYETLYDFESEK